MAIKFKSGASPDDVSMMLKAQANRAKDLSPILNASATAIKKLMDDAFNIKASPDGQQWASNKPSTLRHKTGTLGVETGALKSSIFARVEGNKIIFGASVPYAKAFNEGSTRLGSLAHTSYSGGTVRQAGSAFSVVTPGRAFLPTFKAGAAQAVILIIKRWILEYIKTGKLPL